jgi:hypothetical protein
MVGEACLRLKFPLTNISPSPKSQTNGYYPGPFKIEPGFGWSTFKDPKGAKVAPNLKIGASLVDAKL